MQLFILGATGRIGSQLLALALARGHQVTAFVRSPQKLTPHANLKVIAGDPLDTNALRAALNGQQTVISAFGASSKEALRPSTLMTDHAKALVPAMEAAHVSRLVTISAAVLFPGRGPLFMFFKWFLRHHVRDLQGMEAIVQKSDLVWTLARPARLVQTDDARYTATPGANGASSMSFRSVATFMLDVAESAGYPREVVGLA